jgi:hypothetical protein
MKLKYLQHYPIGGNNAIQIKDRFNNIFKVQGIELDSSDIKIYTGSSFFVYDSEKMKLILRPMSDLYKEINGKIDIIELAKIAFPKKKFEVRQSGCWHRSEKFLYDKATKSFRTLYEDGGAFSEGSQVLYQLPLFEYLFDNHYNVFGLPEDEFININTINYYE